VGRNSANSQKITMKIFTNGCFDVLHIGHIRLLKFCKSLGDTVTVGLNSDSSVRKLKGDGRPLDRDWETSKQPLVNIFIVIF